MSMSAGKDTADRFTEVSTLLRSPRYQLGMVDKNVNYNKYTGTQYSMP